MLRYPGSGLENLRLVEMYELQCVQARTFSKAEVPS